MNNFLNYAIGDVLRAVPNKALGLIGAPRNSEGSQLAPDVRVSLEALKLLSKDFSELPPGKGRTLIDEDSKLGAGRPLEVASVREQVIAGVRVRHYRPQGSGQGASLGDVLPTLVYLHGGGWVLGSLESHDCTARFLCATARVAVLAVDYPLAPENPFPAGLNAVDAVLDAALSGEVEGVDKQRVAVGGDSAGGNLSAAVCVRRARMGRHQPRLQMLFVPVTDLAGMGTGSYREFREGFYLTEKQMRWYLNHYLQGQDATNPEVSPLRAEDSDLAKVAPAYVAVAGFDPLRDEGRAYAERLKAVGVPTTLTTHSSLIHPFVNTFAIWEDARDAMHQAAGALRLALDV